MVPVGFTVPSHIEYMYTFTWKNKIYFSFTTSPQPSILARYRHMTLSGYQLDLLNSTPNQEGSTLTVKSNFACTHNFTTEILRREGPSHIIERNTF